MGWDERLFDLLDDLEGQAEALYAAERDAELADRSRAEYAVGLPGQPADGVDRPSGGRSRSRAPGASGASCAGSAAAGAWCRATTGDWLVCVDAVTSFEGASDRAVPEVAWSAVSRLGLGSALRRLADDATRCMVVTRAGGRHEVELVRVGKDFVEAETCGEPPRRLLLALAAVGAVQSRDPR